MTYPITSEEAYKQVMKQVEAYLQIATAEGGFHQLDAAQRADLQYLSNLAEAWENKGALMPIPKNPHPQSTI